MKKDIASFDRIWSALAEATLNLLRKGIDTAEIISNLRLVRTLINSYDALSTPSQNSDIVSRIRYDLRNLEDLVVIQAANHLGMSYALDLSDKLTRLWNVKEKKVMMPNIIMSEVKKR